MRAQFWQTFRLSIPLIVSNVAHVGLVLTDSAMIGVLDYRQLAASALVFDAQALPMVTCLGFSLAVSPLVAIARGAENKFEVGRSFYNALWLNTIVGVLLVLLCLLASPGLAHLGQDPVIIPYAIPYFRITAISFLPLILYTTAKHFTDALEHPLTGMWLALMSLPLNALLNWIFIDGKLGLPAMELFGAGVSTLITRIIMAMLMLMVVFNQEKFSSFLQGGRQVWKWSNRVIKDLAGLGIPASLQMLMEAGAFAFSGIMVGWLGASTQASHQISLNIVSTTFMIAVGFSTAASIRVSRAYGARHFKVMQQIGRSTQYGGLIYGLACLTLLIIFRNLLPLLFSREASVITIAADLILVAAVFQVSDSLQAIGAGILRGIKDVRIPTLMIFIAYWVVGIPLGYLFSFELEMGAQGIWIGLLAGLTAAAIFLNLRFNAKAKSLSTHYNYDSQTSNAMLA